MESPEDKGKTSQKARELYQYINNNREGLLPYDKRGITIPDPGEGIVYKGMRIHETQNCTVITMRMKHRRMRWSISGASNLAKALHQKENKELLETIDIRTDIYYTDGECGGKVERSKSVKKDGKRNLYVDVIRAHIPITAAMQTTSRKAFC